jgi:hypothetical protein
MCRLGSVRRNESQGNWRANALQRDSSTVPWENEWLAPSTNGYETVDVCDGMPADEVNPFVAPIFKRRKDIECSRRGTTRNDSRKIETPED